MNVDEQAEILGVPNVRIVNKNQHYKTKCFWSALSNLYATKTVDIKMSDVHDLALRVWLLNHKGESNRLNESNLPNQTITTNTKD